MDNDRRYDLAGWDSNRRIAGQQYDSSDWGESI